MDDISRQPGGSTKMNAKTKRITLLGDYMDSLTQTVY